MKEEKGLKRTSRGGNLFLSQMHHDCSDDSGVRDEQIGE